MPRTKLTRRQFPLLANHVQEVKHAIEMAQRDHRTFLRRFTRRRRWRRRRSFAATLDHLECPPCPFDRLPHRALSIIRAHAAKALIASLKSLPIGLRAMRTHLPSATKW